MVGLVTRCAHQETDPDEARKVTRGHAEKIRQCTLVSTCVVIHTQHTSSLRRSDQCKVFIDHPGRAHREQIRIFIVWVSSYTPLICSVRVASRKRLGAI